MAESSCFSSSSLYSRPPIRISRPFLPTSFKFSVSLSSRRHHHCLRLAAKSSDAFDFFPWSNSDFDIEWVQEERVTLFTADGLVQIGSSVVPRRVSSSDSKQGKSKASPKSQRFQECNYMDPNQGLCLGALFDIAATNVWWSVFAFPLLPILSVLKFQVSNGM